MFSGFEDPEPASTSQVEHLGRWRREYMDRGIPKEFLAEQEIPIVTGSNEYLGVRSRAIGSTHYVDWALV